MKARATADTQISDNPYPFSWVNMKEWGNNLGIWGVGQLGVSVSWVQTAEEARPEKALLPQFQPLEILLFIQRAHIGFIEYRIDLRGFYIVCIYSSILTICLTYLFVNIMISILYFSPFI